MRRKQPSVQSLRHYRTCLNVQALFRALARIAARLRADRTQLLACALGITGAALVAQTRSPHLMLAGFACWSVSNLLLVRIEWRAGHPWVAGMFAVYEITALIGLVNTAGLVL